MTAAEDMFQSPAYPGDYPSNKYISWNITVASGATIELNVDISGIQWTEGCTADVLLVKLFLL